MEQRKLFSYDDIEAWWNQVKKSRPWKYLMALIWVTFLIADQSSVNEEAKVCFSSQFGAILFLRVGRHRGSRVSHSLECVTSYQRDVCWCSACFLQPMGWCHPHSGWIFPPLLSFSGNNPIDTPHPRCPSWWEIQSHWQWRLTVTHGNKSLHKPLSLKWSLILRWNHVQMCHLMLQSLQGGMHISVWNRYREHCQVSAT